MCLLFITFSKVINMFIKFLVTKKYRSDCNPFIKSSIFNREKKKKKNQSIELVLEVTYSKQKNTLWLFYIEFLLLTEPH